MCSRLKGLLTTFLMLIPLGSVPLLAIFGIPQFAPVVASPSDDAPQFSLDEELSRKEEAESEADAPPSKTPRDIFAPVSKAPVSKNETSPRSRAVVDPLKDESDRWEDPFEAQREASPNSKASESEGGQQYSQHSHSPNSWDPPSDALGDWELESSESPASDSSTNLAGEFSETRQPTSNTRSARQKAPVKNVFADVPRRARSNEATPRGSVSASENSHSQASSSSKGTFQLASAQSSSSGNFSEPSSSQSATGRGLHTPNSGAWGSIPDHFAEETKSRGNGPNAREASQAGAERTPSRALPDRPRKRQPLTWQEAVRRLNEMGIREYRLQPGEYDDQFLFCCDYTPKDSPRITHRFEAEAGEPLRAVQKVLEQIEEWHNHH